MREMATRQLAEKQAKKKGFWGGLGNFASDFGGAVVDMAANPLETGKRLASQAKETFVTPIIDLPKAFDPTNNMGLVDRANTAISGGLALADAVTPFIPEGTMANSLQREAMNRMLDDEAARYAASGGGMQYRGTLAIHGSPKNGLTEILPFTGSQAMPNERVAFGYGATDLLPSSGLSSATHSPTLAIPKMYAGMREAATATDVPTVYAVRFPSKSAINPNDPYIRVFNEPGQVVASVPASASSRRFTEAVKSVMTPMEKRRWMELRVKEQLARSQQRRDITNMIRGGGDF